MTVRAGRLLWLVLRPRWMRNRQVGPDSATEVLAALVPRCSYKDWTLDLQELSRGQGCEGLTLLIGATVPDSTRPGETTSVLHLMPVLPAAYCEEAWIGWVFEQIRLVELHESMEHFRVDGVAPFFADHGPGRSPYEVMRVKPGSQPEEVAVPWSGGPCVDEHFKGE